MLFFVTSFHCCFIPFPIPDYFSSPSFVLVVTVQYPEGIISGSHYLYQLSLSLSPSPCSHPIDPSILHFHSPSWSCHVMPCYALDIHTISISSQPEPLIITDKEITKKRRIRTNHPPSQAQPKAKPLPRASIMQTSVYVYVRACVF